MSLSVGRNAQEIGAAWLHPSVFHVLWTNDLSYTRKGPSQAAPKYFSWFYNSIKYRLSYSNSQSNLEYGSIS